MNKITIPALQKPEDSGKPPGRGKDGTGVRYRRRPRIWGKDDGFER